MEKEELLKEIEKLLSFDGKEAPINPEYLRYFTTEELESILKGLQKKQQNMVEENFEWLLGFAKKR